MKKYIIGVDVSKLKLDYHCHGFYTSPEPVTNDLRGFKNLFAWIKKQVSKEVTNVIVVMEYTGIYTYNFERFLNQKGVDYVKRPALDIKRSVGIKRGKTDKADAKMISQYGWMRREELKAMKPLSDSEQELQQLMAYRDKLVADKASYQSRLKELHGQMKDKLSQHIIESTEYLMQVLAIEIKQTEKFIAELLSSQKSLNINFELMKTITGIGFSSAVHFLIATENFTRFNDHRKFACYCGVAPFEHSSGSSIKGKTRVSHLANKKIKSLLTMAAISAVQHDPQMKAKYEQKLKEGKAKMCALNIIRYKLIERIFAVIKRQTPYELRVAA
jgi:transposase